MIKDDFAVLGRILKTQGIKGELRVALLFEFTELLHEFCKEQNSLYVEDSNTGEFHCLKTEGFWVHSRGFGIFKFCDVNSINDAEKYVGLNLLIPVKQRWRLPQNNFYIDQVVGLNVIDIKTGISFGKVSEVMENFGNDLYVVTNGKTKFYMPAVKEIVKEIDIEAGVLKVEMPEGLIEIYE